MADRKREQEKGKYLGVSEEDFLEPYEREADTRAGRRKAGVEHPREGRTFRDYEPRGYNLGRGRGEDWDVPGPMSGLGPRTYEQTAENIQEEVCERLARHGQLDARKIRVEVEDGEVTLQGTVPDRRSKRMAEDTAASVPGVFDVHNRLRLSDRNE
jgi:hypothetical protein